ncbi:Hint domain-containing protein [Actibacterium ureilyticum]|uniref:Hint domain-containing protein n=1 Tax=Actibacterium ureilyticum TaxID=1590614 RepID=UPI0015959607|nr:Hint domain-containing protein [Actibacterium ureilyticum]
MFHQDPAQFDPAQTDAARIVAPHRPTAFRGLTGGTLLETESGWRPVDAITVGDRIHSFDGGLRQVQAVRRHFVTRDALITAGILPVRIAGGTLGACSDLVLMPGQGVLCPVEAARHGGQEHRLIAARDLRDRAGVAQRPARAALALTELGFAEEEILWANTGVLLHCPAAGAWDARWGIYAQDPEPRPVPAMPVRAPVSVAA